MLAGLVLSLGLSVAVQAGPLTSGCERCHLALPERPGGPHVTEWVESAHAAHTVGCVRCHNGDATAADVRDAHRFVLPAALPTSPVHPAQLPVTCGQCHPRQAARFTGSRHGALLAAGAANVPSCASCHGAMRASVPSPTTLEAVCASCHRDDPAHGSLPSDARVLIEWVASTRERLAALQPLIERDTDDVSRRVRWAAFDRAANRTDDAVGGLHAFDLELARAELLLARDALAVIESGRARRTGETAASAGGVPSPSRVKLRRPADAGGYPRMPRAQLGVPPWWQASVPDGELR